MALDGGGSHGRHVGRLRHVGGEARGAVADLGRRRLGIGAGAGDDEYLRPLAREHARDALADAFGGAGDDDGAAGDGGEHRFLLSDQWREDRRRTAPAASSRAAAASTVKVPSVGTIGV